MNLRAQRVVFAGTSRLTDAFPVAGARLLDGALLPVLGSRALAAHFGRRNRRVMRRVRAFRRFLVIPDIHIGDAVMTQSAVTALREYFPDAQIDYVIGKLAAPLVQGNPEATRVLPIFSGGQFPAADDAAALREVIRAGHYDLCLSFGPFMEPADLMREGAGPPFVSFMTHAPVLLRNERDPAEINHFSYQYRRFVHALFAGAASPAGLAPFRGVRTTFADDAIGHAARYAAEAGLASGAPVIMINPDGACRFTLLPVEHEADLVRRIAAETPPDARLLLGAGHTFAGIGQRLVDSLPGPLRTKCRIIPPSMPLAAYAALMDLADVFITGDTGPMHIAAARRYARSGAHRFRNRTAVLSLFGATVPRMSGYDSTRPGYLPANQDAPSWCYQATSPCRNITCLNKYFKTCRAVRCFEGADPSALAALVVAHVRGLPSRPGCAGAAADAAPVPGAA